MYNASDLSREQKVEIIKQHHANDSLTSLTEQQILFIVDPYQMSILQGKPQSERQKHYLA